MMNLATVNPSEVTGEVQVRALADLSEGTREVVGFTVSAAQMQAFAALSGDTNPLHTDAAFARDKGFDGVVVYGALIVAKVSQLIGMKLPGRDSVWVSVLMDFRKPLYVDQAAEVEGVVSELSQSTGLVTLKLTVRANGKTVAKGQAEVLIGK